jgi:hypothetical protein
MGRKYVSTVEVTIDGQQIKDFQNFTENKRDLKKAVKLMGGRGSIETTQEYGFKMDYVLPKDAAEFDFEALTDSTVIVDKLNGVRIRFSGVEVLTIGETKYADDKEAVQSIEFSATGRKAA